MPRTFRRVIAEPKPTRDDLLSHAARGLEPITNDPPRPRAAQRVSVFATFAQARRHARISPRQGGYIAELLIPDDAPMTSL
ncbi:MAG: hypothetical protein IT307_06725, partial [Chloroflexi bacterium]|nr:hypothetical protein [Chloroflexota bacterium]